MKNKFLTPVGDHYEINSWNPVIETQDKDENQSLSQAEKNYILSYKKIWDELSKH